MQVYVNPQCLSPPNDENFHFPYPGLFMNTGAPSLVHLPATNFFSVIRKHGYGLPRKNLLQQMSCAIITPIHE